MFVLPAAAQDWFKTGTGLGVSKARLAVPDTAARSTAAQPLAKTFHDVLWADLEYSGILDMVSPSFYPTQVPSQPSELKAQDWAAAPANAYMVAYGNMTQRRNGRSVLRFSLRRAQSHRAAGAAENLSRRGHRRRCAAAGASVRGRHRRRAERRPARHRADADRLRERESGNKEIWVMDYDGANQHQVTHLKSISLTPRWSPDATRIAFTCYVPYRGVTSAQICIYSTASDRLIAFPRYRGTNSSPAWSPDGSQIAFMSSQDGDPEIYVADAERRAPASHHVRGGREHIAGVESEDRQADGFRERPRRVTRALSFELRRIERAEDQSAGHGIRDRSGVVTKWTIAGI